MPNNALCTLIALLNALASHSTHSDVMKISREGGSDVDISLVPWSVRVEMIDVGYCTGSIISKTWVLTAGHCVAITTLPAWPVPLWIGVNTNIRIAYGSSVKNSPNELAKNVSRVVLHPKYLGETVAGYDFALIEVEGEFEFNERAQPLELDGQWPLTDGKFNARDCLASGWGMTDANEESEPSVIRSINMTAMHGAKACDCLPAYLNKRMVCSKGFGICFGDSGGALVCGNKGVGVAHSIGRFPIDSCKNWVFITDEPTCNDWDGINIYMFVCPALDWIRQYVRNVTRTPASCLSDWTVPSGTVVTATVFLTLQYVFTYTSAQFSQRHPRQSSHAYTISISPFRSLSSFSILLPG